MFALLIYRNYKLFIGECTYIADTIRNINCIEVSVWAQRNRKSSFCSNLTIEFVRRGMENCFRWVFTLLNMWGIVWIVYGNCMRVMEVLQSLVLNFNRFTKLKHNYRVNDKRLMPFTKFEASSLHLTKVSFTGGLWRTCGHVDMSTLPRK